MVTPSGMIMTQYTRDLTLMGRMTQCLELALNFPGEKVRELLEHINSAEFTAADTRMAPKNCNSLYFSV